MKREDRLHILSDILISKPKVLFPSHKKRDLETRGTGTNPQLCGSVTNRSANNDASYSSMISRPSKLCETQIFRLSEERWKIGLVEKCCGEFLVSSVGIRDLDLNCVSISIFF